MPGIPVKIIRNFLFILLVLLIIPQYSSSQVYDHPNFSFSSHETLDLERIEIDTNQTRVFLSITNKKLSGTFCADPNTFIQNSLGNEQYRLTESINIPDCPDVYKFNAIGEKLDFILIFPPVSKNLKYIDIIEKCEEACLNVKYILLDQELNGIINQGFSLYEEGNLTGSLKVFSDLMAARNDNLSPVFGTVCLYLMTINKELGRSEEVRKLSAELQQSSIINKDEILEAARFEGLIK